MSDKRVYLSGALKRKRKVEQKEKFLCILYIYSDYSIDLKFDYRKDSLKLSFSEV